MNARRFAFMLVFFLIAASSARADAGTALMWTGMLHLFIGNWLIALFEAAVISAIFRVSYGRSALWLTLANYVSYFTGVLLVLVTTGSLEVASGTFVLRHGMFVLVGLIATSYLMSVFVEWPFCFALAAPGAARPLSGLKISVVAQTASYFVLVPFYLVSSPITLLTQARVQQDAGFAAPAVATVYFIRSNGEVWQVGSDGTGRRSTGIKGVVPDEGIWLAPDKAGQGDLWAVYHADSEPLADNARVLL
jgi:hypothetical protein